LVFLPASKLAADAGGSELMVNIVASGFVWGLMGLDVEILASVIREMFSSKPKYIEVNVAALKAGYSYSQILMPPMTARYMQIDEIPNAEKLKLHTADIAVLKSIFNLTTWEPVSTESAQNRMLVAGNDALSIGAVRAGVRLFFAYPMTPSSSILTYLGERIHETGMIVKQAEDEITAADMTIGAMHMGARALTATSGGGFDLMTEHISLAAITEIPFVCVLAMRPGPATGLPTWTAQGDLLLACFAGHGEYTRLVISLTNVNSCFEEIQNAFNLAEKYQIPVFVLTDKLLAENLYTVDKFNADAVKFDRGSTVLDEKILSTFTSASRFDLEAKDGISPRWLPGAKAATFNANSDEHDEEGNVSEEAVMAEAMMIKRLKKEPALAAELPEAEVFGETDPLKTKLVMVGWGSTETIALDVLAHLKELGVAATYISYKYVFPFKPNTLMKYSNLPEKLVLLENNATAQFGKLIRMETGLNIEKKFLKFDGRPFFYEEVLQYLNSTGMLS